MMNSYKDIHSFFANKLGEDLVINNIYPYSVQKQPVELQKDIISFKLHIDSQPSVATTTEVSATEGCSLLYNPGYMCPAGRPAVPAYHAW